MVVVVMIMVMVVVVFYLLFFRKLMFSDEAYNQICSLDLDGFINNPRNPSMTQLFFYVVYVFLL